MSDSIGSIQNYALSGLLAAESQANQAAQNIADFGAPTSPFATNAIQPLTGTAATGAAGAVQQATGGTDLAAQLIDLLTARNAFAANIATLNVGSQVVQQALNIVT